MPELVTVLGSTGSIGVNTLDVLRTHKDKYQVFALTAHSQVELLVKQCLEFQPQYAVFSQQIQADKAKELLAELKVPTEVLCGVHSLQQVAGAPEVNTVVAAIVGAAGLEPTMAAVRTGKKVLLANKESLVMAGELFISEVKEHQACLMPVDSEHNAIFQCLPDPFDTLAKAGVKRILLTGSGGPFREFSIDDLKGVSPEEACAHPNWDMGKKISVDSATMMNKGLEFIEACWMFNAQPEQIEVVLHPQSIVHSMVEYIDGSVLAQMGSPDMRTPIANCLAWPERIDAPVNSLDFMNLSLDFSSPDENKFPCLRYAKQAMKAGGDYPAAVNAANEVAVEAFLNRHIAFTSIAKTVDVVVQSWVKSEPDTILAVIESDKRARNAACKAVASLAI